MFTCNPVTGDPSMVAINASWGLGAAVVGGDVTPDDYLVSKVTGEVVRERIADKSVQCVPHPAGQGTELVDVPERCAISAASTPRGWPSWSRSRPGSSRTSAATRTSSGRSRAPGSSTCFSRAR